MPSLNVDNRQTYRSRRRSPWRLPQEEIEQIQSLARFGWSRREIAEDRDLSLGVVGKYAKGIKIDPTAPTSLATGRVPANISDQEGAELRSLLARLESAKPERQEESVKPTGPSQPLDSSNENSPTSRYPGLSFEDRWAVTYYRKICDLVARTSRLSSVQEYQGDMDYFLDVKRSAEQILERRGLTRYIT